jgi:hypothetical protein
VPRLKVCVGVQSPPERDDDNIEGLRRVVNWPERRRCNKQEPRVRIELWLKSQRPVLPRELSVGRLHLKRSWSRGQPKIPEGNANTCCTRAAAPRGGFKSSPDTSPNAWSDWGGYVIITPTEMVLPGNSDAASLVRAIF